MITIPATEYIKQLKAQQVPIDDQAFVCPLCGKVQSAVDLIKAGAGKDMDEVMKYLGYSCVGRWTNAGPPRKTKDGKGCNWTLGGLFKLHEIEILGQDGKRYPRFAVATPAQARFHMEENQAHEGF
jgi:hypothetical protein